MILENIIKMSHSPVTDFSKNRINNPDMVVLYLGCQQHKTTFHINEIISFLKTWRPRNYTYLFQMCDRGGYNFAGKSFESKFSIVNYQYKRPNYWYRKARGSYALTELGVKRFFELFKMYAER